MQTEGYVATNGGGGRAADMWSRGTKRGASDSNLSDFERFEKRLRLLSLRSSEKQRNGKSNHLYTPVSNHPTAATSNGPLLQANHVKTQPDDGMMQVDDTRDRVFIGDLDAELADIDSDEEKLIFLPDIEKKLSKLPRQVLGGRDDDNEGQELVLYSVPKSLSVDESHDSVRKAIIEARQRARDKAAEEARYADMERRYNSGYQNAAETAHGYSAGYIPDQELEDDPDAMDLG